MNIAELAQRAELQQLQHERSLLELLDHLRAIDPEAAERATYVFDDEASAAHWLASPVMSLGGVMPLQVLGQISHGVYA